MTDDSGPSAPMYPGETDAPSSLDTAFALLARERRRTVLHCLGASDGPLSLSELADRVAEREAADSTPEGLEREIAISLSQVHLPKLADAGVVKYERDTQRVEYRGDPLVETLLDQTPGREQ